MSQRKKIATRLKSKFSSLAGRTSKERGANSLGNKLSVHEEYKAAFRTESYIEMWSKVQGQLRRISFDKLLSSSSSSSSSSLSSSSLHLYMHLSEDLLEPRQQIVDDMIGSNNLHHFIIEYFRVSLEACNICELILRSIHQARDNYQIIKRVIKLTKKFSDHSANYTDGHCHLIYRELAKFALLKNPLSIISPVEFHDIHDNYKALLRNMTSKCKRVEKRAKFTKFCKKVAGFSLVTSYSALTIALLVMAFHSMIGIVAAPVLVACSAGMLKKRFKLAKKGLETSMLDRLGAQIDVAAKGLYILLNDLDTMSRLVGRLHDEIEHSKTIAKVCIRNTGKEEVLKQVVKEFHIHEPYFMEHLEELEEHIYLCFLTINRSRMLVIQEIIPPHE